MNKTKSLPRALLTGALLTVVIRIIALLSFSAIAYATADPGGQIFLFTMLCKCICDILCGAFTAISFGNDFSVSTRVVMAVGAVVILNVAELLLGKLIFDSDKTAFYMIPISVLSAFFGSFTVSKKKSAHKKRRRIRR